MSVILQAAANAEADRKRQAALFGKQNNYIIWKLFNTYIYCIVTPDNDPPAATKRYRHMTPSHDDSDHKSMSEEKEDKAFNNKGK